MTEFCDIQSLVKLFNPPRDDSDSEEESNVEETSRKTPTKTEETKPNPYAKLEPQKAEKPEDWDGDFSAFDDWKKTPKWNISYRQKVTASDVFLQMGAKTPATSSCEDMVVVIELPGERMQNMDIKVHPKQLEVYSPNYSLSIDLPQPVHPQKGDAKWDKDQEKLTITLTMDREFDFINF